VPSLGRRGGGGSGSGLRVGGYSVYKPKPKKAGLLAMTCEKLLSVNSAAQSRLSEVKGGGMLEVGFCLKVKIKFDLTEKKSGKRAKRKGPNYPKKAGLMPSRGRADWS